MALSRSIGVWSRGILRILEDVKEKNRDKISLLELIARDTRIPGNGLFKLLKVGCISLGTSVASTCHTSAVSLK